MSGIDPEEFGRELSQIVKDHVQAQLEPLLERVAALEARAGKAAPPRKRKGGRK